MSDAFAYTFPSPLEGYKHLPPLTDERNADGRSYYTPSDGKLSQSYEKFVEPICNGPGPGFDVHIYYLEKNAEQKQFARELWERIRREFPELKIYEFWEKPIGPHPVAMFEVNLFTPAQFGAFIPWLVINRGPLSALVHPNSVNSVTGELLDDVRDHSQRATWMGERFPLDLALLSKVTKTRKEKRAAAVAAAAAQEQPGTA